MSKLLYRAHNRTDASTGFGTQFDGRLAGEPPYRRDSRGVHYEFLSCLSVRRVEPRFNIRIGVVFGVCGAIAAHTVEVWIFAFAYFFVHRASGWGELLGQFGGGLMDCVYFSFTTVTTLGFDDIHPVGSVRFLTGVEALTGWC